ncbi:TonB-dependent receptor [Xanthomonas citri]|uniref:TonB-dependent receptor n=1 Tax=Xanthomonas citri TaxID=346 RepID=UPI0001CED574|nr:TonB-dependent receptor [Xanthomonas citri]AMU99525.1 TonB-dependent receptor [Xanthomonas citri pv. aurantifolii]AMV04031.1 TonB-dependent receptor [Xanthomonas citri pv. aurantifolii]EFF48924.1 colicin I receptor [Xanthomonas citri pv. aurantifolii str. ICPB 10535]MCC8490396.1 TonB-dependent receptor [Xanthomonas citri pv. fuscans]TBW93852.1 TonB-dependent receptor [Xanthomonas citri pv. aurantifolii]
MTPRLLSAAITVALLAAPIGAAFAADADSERTTDLDTVNVIAKLEAARNALSPDIGSSQFAITAEDIDRLPLGAATQLNQVLLQAPGVVQDSYGGIHVRGDHANLQYRINGVIIPESISGFGQSLEPRIIKNLKLLDGALPAQFGDRTAAVVDITSKNGAELGNGGSVGITAGSYGTINPNASLWGSSGRWSWFVSGDYDQNKNGLENPVDSLNPLHDKTHQGKGFADLTYLVNEDTRLSLLVGYANNRFQIPNNPGQTPAFDYQGTTDFDSSRLDENQRENTRFGTLALQGTLGDTNYQLSAGQRYSSVAFSPDVAGDLIFNGIASQVDRSNRANIVQADFATPWGGSHTLRYGVYGNFEHAIASNNSYVFPANDDGSQSSNVPLFILDGSRFHASTYALYLQDEWKIGEDWTVNYGLRGDKYKAFGTTEGQLSPRLGVIWRTSDSTTLHAGYARYFTPPASELISTSDIALYDGTTNQQSAGDGPTTPLSERSDYYDLGISQVVTDHLTLGLDTYYRKADRLQDEGQFGAAYVYSTFNYRYGRIRGAEFSADYTNGPVTAYFNLAYSKAMGKRVMTSLYNFDPDALAYTYDNWIHLDHDQKLTSSGGVNYAFSEGSKVGLNYLFGSGLRTDTDTVPNGASLPSYFQLNASVGHDFDVNTHPLHVQLAAVNVLNRSYQLRDGGGIGVFAPQWAPRRGVYVSLQQDF